MLPAGRRVEIREVETADRKMKSAARKFGVSVAGAFHGIGLQKYSSRRDHLSGTRPKKLAKQRFVCPKMAAALRRAGREQCIRGDEGHVIRAGDEQLVFLIRPAALEKEFCAMQGWPPDRSCQANLLSP